MKIVVDKNTMKVMCPERFENKQSVDLDDMNLPRRKPFMEVGIVFLRELKKINKEIVVEDFWGWGSEIKMLKPIYEANKFNPIPVNSEHECVNKMIREINERLNHSNENLYYDIFPLETKINY